MKKENKDIFFLLSRYSLATQYETSKMFWRYIHIFPLILKFKQYLKIQQLKASNSCKIANVYLTSRP